MTGSNFSLTPDKWYPSPKFLIRFGEAWPAISKCHDLVDKWYRPISGKGGKILLLVDFWIGNSFLKSCYLRVFNVANSKSSKRLRRTNAAGFFFYRMGTFCLEGISLPLNSKVDLPFRTYQSSKASSLGGLQNVDSS